MNEDLQGEASGFKNPNDSDHPKHGEGASIATCRMCYGDEEDDLISPCMCKGTQQYVHRSCLDHWRSVMGGLVFLHCSTCKAQFHLRVVELEANELENTQRKRKFFSRDVCLAFLAVQSVIGMMGVVAYLVDKDGSLRNLFNGNWERILLRHPILFYYYIGVLVFFGLIGLVLPLTLAICLFPYMKLQSLRCLLLLMVPFIKNHKDRESYTLTDCLVMFAIAGIAYSFLIFMYIIIFITLERRHSYILPKREHTKKYMVEDLGGCYTPAKLDHQHLERLKTLKLISSKDARLVVTG